MANANELKLAAAGELITQAQRLLGELDLRTVKSPAEYLVDTIKANIDNEKLSDADFRAFIRNSIKD